MRRQRYAIIQQTHLLVGVRCRWHRRSILFVYYRSWIHFWGEVLKSSFILKTFLRFYPIMFFIELRIFWGRFQIRRWLRFWDCGGSFLPLPLQWVRWKDICFWGAILWSNLLEVVFLRYRLFCLSPSFLESVFWRGYREREIETIWGWFLGL